MKLLLVLTVCIAAATAAAAPNVHKLETPAVHKVEDLTDFQIQNLNRNNFLINALLRQMFAYLRYVINNGSEIFGLPVLDPLLLDSYHLVLPAGLINLDLTLKNVDVRGIGAFVVHTSNLDLRTMTFEIDVSIPVIDVKAENYDLVGDLFTAIPVYGKGKVSFVIEGFRIRALLNLKPSEDGTSVIIDSVQDASFEVPTVKSDLTGVIGGGDIDAIVNAIVEEVLFDYINRFQGAISHGAARQAPLALNPFLEMLDTWKYIAPFVPRV